MTKLTEEMVIARSRQSDLSTVKKLNCWGSELSDVSIIRRMRGVEVLALSVNKISSLADFENCQNLQELYLRRNNIKDLSELAYLQGLPNLKYLWLEENPCVERAGPSYRAIVLRTLPNLQKLDNIDVTPEELADARRGSVKRDDVIYEDSSYPAEPQPQQNQQQSQYRQQSPMRENQSLENTEESISDPIDRNSIPSSPIQQRSPSNQEQYSPAETNQPPSPRYQRDHRGSYNQYDVSMRSPGSDQEASPATGYRERVPIAPSMSTHSMKEYYQSDYQKPQHPAHYRHSQMDLTEWDEHQHQGGHPGRRNGGGGEPSRDSYAYRNGNANREDWDENVENRRRESRRSEGRFNDSASVVSNAVLNHYASYHRRPVNRNANLLSATLCLVKELDYPSLEVVEHAVRCRIDELATD